MTAVKENKTQSHTDYYERLGVRLVENDPTYIDKQGKQGTVVDAMIDGIARVKPTHIWRGRKLSREVLVFKMRSERLIEITYACMCRWRSQR